jgi:glycosyltransferase involved in cell wall biosynthesis
VTKAAPVWLYALSLNEMRMLAFFFHHYDPWVDRYIIYDDGSTDKTLSVLASRPDIEIRAFDRVRPDSFVESARVWQNNVWKEAHGKAAWVVVTAIDEHIHHTAMPDYLARCEAAGVTAIPALGFEMVSDTAPNAGETLAITRRTGMPTSEMNKLSLFDPTAIEQTNYSPGRHFATPTGRVVYPEADELLLLHYKYIDKAYLKARHRVLRQGLRDNDVERGLGKQYDWSDADFDLAWDRISRDALDYSGPSVGFATHVERWWRGKRYRGNG